MVLKFRQQLHFSVAIQSQVFLQSGMKRTARNLWKISKSIEYLSKSYIEHFPFISIFDSFYKSVFQCCLLSRIVLFLNRKNKYISPSSELTIARHYYKQHMSHLMWHGCPKKSVSMTLLFWSVKKKKKLITKPFSHI